MIDRNALVSDLAKAYGVRVDVDDPILVAALLNRRLLDEAIAAMEAAVRASADRMTAASVQQTDAARQTAACSSPRPVNGQRTGYGWRLAMFPPQ